MRDTIIDANLENEIANEMMHVVRKMYQCGTVFLESIGIGMGQVPILQVLSENDSLTQRQLASIIRVTPPTLSGTISRLERSGLVQRKTDPDDARITHVHLTDKGRECCDQVFAALNQSHDVVLNGFDTGECEVLLSFMRRMSDNLLKVFDSHPCKEDLNQTCDSET